MPTRARANTTTPRSTANGHPVTARRLPARPPRMASPHGLRIAAIDIGSNSMHMVIVEVTDQLTFRTLAAEKELTRLGAAALVRHRLTRQAMEHTTQVLSRYQRIARGMECDVVLAYATSAVRECVNGGDFVEQLKRDIGLHIQVISSQEEARLVYLAVRQAVDLGEQPVFIVDIGGGSVEFIVGTADRPLLLQSRKLGASRLTQQFITSDPISRADLSAVTEHIHTILKPLIAQVRALGAKRIIGTSGTMENLVAMCLAQYGEETKRHRLLTQMTREDFSAVYKQLRRLPVADRRGIAGLDPGRADQIVAGAALVNYLFEELDVQEIEVSDRAMREGMIIDYMQAHWPKVKLSVQIRDPRRRSIIELGRRCNFDADHAQQVAQLALQIFDQLQDFHGMDEEARELLEFAALVHDVGWHIGHSGHHKHSWYLIKNGDLEGFAQVEIDIIANVARYHRKSPPKKSHASFMELLPHERTLVRKLAAILRIADGLDRGHYANITDLKVRRKGKAVTFRLLAESDPELELWGGRHKTDMFESVFGVQAKFTGEVRSEK